jgi:hypothetical protein
VDPQLRCLLRSSERARRLPPERLLVGPGGPDPVGLDPEQAAGGGEIGGSGDHDRPRPEVPEIGDMARLGDATEALALNGGQDGERAIAVPDPVQAASHPHVLGRGDPRFQPDELLHVLAADPDLAAVFHGHHIRAAVARVGGDGRRPNMRAQHASLSQPLPRRAPMAVSPSAPGWRP